MYHISFTFHYEQTHVVFSMDFLCNSYIIFFSGLTILVLIVSLICSELILISLSK